MLKNVIQKQNKARTSKVGAKSKAQKAQNIFLGKSLQFLIFFSKKSHSAEKGKRGTLLDLLTYIPLQNIKTFEGGTLWGNLKIFEKKSHNADKNPKGDPLGTSGFVGYLEKVKNERESLCTNFALAGLGLRWFQDCF